MGLTSWTRVMNQDAALLVLPLAQPGMPLDEWVELADDALPHAKRETRAAHIRLLRDLVDVRDGHVADTWWHRLLIQGSPGRRRHLVWGRYLFGNPWVELLVDQLVLPRLAAAEEPLAPYDLDRVAPAEWETLVDEHLRPGTGPSSRKKMLTALPGVLERIGVLEGDEPDQRVVRARPDALAFCWLVGHELEQGQRQEAGLNHAATASFAARMWAVDPDYARTCLMAGVAAGVLRQGYLAGQARVHPGAV